jgi:RimJ/RimL family protein N-acetyltransferase
VFKVKKVYAGRMATKSVKFQPIVGSRVTLRQIRADDEAKYFQAVQDPYRQSMQGIDGEAARSPEAVHRELTLLASDPNAWAIERDECLGFIKLSGVNYFTTAAWLSIDIFRNEDCGQGYGSESIKLVLNRAFRRHKLPAVKLDVHKQNPAIILYERLNFKEFALGCDSRVRPTYLSAERMVMILPAWKFFAAQTQP